MTINLSALRKARRLSQAQLASMLGIVQGRCSDIEVSPEKVSLGQILRFLDVLGVDLSLSMRDNWTPPERQEHSYVYVIAHKDLPFFKIGKANNVELRAEMLGAVDAASSLQLRASSERAAFAAEALLHRAFLAWRQQPEIVASLGVPISGGLTEWFSSECLDRVHAFVQTNLDLLGAEIVSKQELLRTDPAL